MLAEWVVKSLHKLLKGLCILKIVLHERNESGLKCLDELRGVIKFSSFCGETHLDFLSRGYFSHQTSSAMPAECEFKDAVTKEIPWGVRKPQTLSTQTLAHITLLSEEYIQFCIYWNNLQQRKKKEINQHIPTSPILIDFQEALIF